MIIFIADANVFWADPNLSGEDWMLITEFVQRQEGKLIVPQVVIDEVVNNFRKQITGAVSAASKARSDISRLTGKQVPATLKIDSEKEARDYETRLKYILNTLRAEILPYPKVSHPDLVKRALNRRKPFNEAGSGYRDSLIWLSVIAHQPLRGFECVLITENSSDFAAGRDRADVLHPHLEAEWKEAGFDRPIHLLPKLSAFVDSFVKPALERLDGLKADLENGKPLDLVEYLQGQFEAVFQGVNSKLALDSPDGVLEEPFGVSELSERPTSVRILDVLALDGNNVYIEFVAEYEGTAFAYVFKSSAASLNELSGFHVCDWNWNEHYAEVEGSVVLEVVFGMTFDRSSKTVLSFEVRSAENQSRDSA
jgi:hypothetical protein